MPIFKDPNTPIEKRVEDLLARMTQAEKIGQLVQRSLVRFEENRKNHLEALREGRVGAFVLSLSAWAAEDRTRIHSEALNQLQQSAVEESRLGIPVLFGRDVIHGHRTVFPIPLAQAASWNLPLVEEAMSIAAREAAAEGVHWTFAPMIDITRDPRWGRVIEGFGEDPWLTSRLAEACVHGFQGDDPAHPERILACAKHFAGYGGSEGGRDYDTSEWSENTLHNMLLPPFRAAVEAGVATIMSGFNDLGGTPVSASRPLMRDWLKQGLEWDGFIVSDWGSVLDLIAHGVAADPAEATEKAFNAGVDMEMSSNGYSENMGELIEQGRVSQAFLDDAVRRILRAKFRAGLFENPYCDLAKKSQPQRRPEHLQTALKLAEQSLVLLKNQDSILPLAPEGASVAVIGPYAEAKGQCLGSWVLDGLPSEVVSILEGIQKVAPNLSLLTADAAFTDEMISCALKAEIVVLCVGESATRTGENKNITSLELPPGQEDVIREIGRRGVPMVVVLCNGRPIPSPAAEQYASAIIQTWHLGSEMGNALARVLFGKTVPSGKLPITIPRRTGQIPLYYNRKFPGKLREIDDACQYQDESWDPLYPFGFGLSYTSFVYSNLQLSADTIRRGDKLIAHVDLKNSGDVAGEEIVQLYIGDVAASTSRPVRELRGFQRVALESGETQTVRFEIGPEQLSFYGVRQCWEVEPGQFRVWIGGCSQAELGAHFQVTG